MCVVVRADDELQPALIWKLRKSSDQDLLRRQETGSRPSIIQQTKFH